MTIASAPQKDAYSANASVSDMHVSDAPTRTLKFL